MSAIVLRSDGRSDFRSDTVTLPTEAMRAAMAAAELSTGSCWLNGSAGVSVWSGISSRPGAPVSQ